MVIRHMKKFQYIEGASREHLCILTLSRAAPDPGICYGGGGLPEGRQCMRSCLNGGGGCSPLTTGGGGGGGGGGGAVGKSHSLLKHKEHHGKRVHSAPALSCSTASLTFVRTTELSGLLSMAQHIICRSLSSGRGGGGGGGGKSCKGAAFHTRWGGRPPPPPPPRLCWIRGCSRATEQYLLCHGCYRPVAARNHYPIIHL